MSVTIKIATSVTLGNLICYDAMTAMIFAFLNQFVPLFCKPSFLVEQVSLCYLSSETSTTSTKDTRSQTPVCLTVKRNTHPHFQRETLTLKQMALTTQAFKEPIILSL